MKVVWLRRADEARIDARRGRKAEIEKWLRRNRREIYFSWGGLEQAKYIFNVAHLTPPRLHSRLAFSYSTHPKEKRGRKRIGASEREASKASGLRWNLYAMLCEPRISRTGWRGRRKLIDIRNVDYFKVFISPYTFIPLQLWTLSALLLFFSSFRWLLCRVPSFDGDCTFFCFNAVFFVEFHFETEISYLIGRWRPVLAGDGSRPESRFSRLATSWKSRLPFNFSQKFASL